MKRLVLANVRGLLGPRQHYNARPVDIVIEGERIAAIRPAAGATVVLGGDHDEDRIDCTDRLVVPGLINGHYHSHEHYHKGRYENLPLEIWMHFVRAPKPVRFTARQVYLRTMIGALESLRTGATTVVDDCSLGASIDREHVDAMFQAYADTGIRALVGFSMMNKPIVDNFPFAAESFPPEMLQSLRSLQPPSQASMFALVRELAKQHYPSSNRMGMVVAPSAPQRCTPEFLRDTMSLADELDLAVISHVQETRLQVVTGQQFYGKTIIEFMRDVGMLRPRTTLIHAAWLNFREIALLAETGATAQHNPWSNLMLGSGVQPVRALLDAGVNVSLGTDGCSSTVTANMLQTVGSAAALSKIRGDDYSRWLSAAEAYRAGTVGGAQALGLDHRIGTIEVGKTADLVLYRLDAIPFVPLADPIRQLVYAERGANIDTVQVAGEPVVRAGRLTRVDESALLAEINAEHETSQAQFGAAEESVRAIKGALDAMLRRADATPIATDTYPSRFV